MSPQPHLVIWGLRRKYDTYRYIHAGFAAAGERLGWKVDWLDDSPSNQEVVTAASLVVGVNLAQRFMPEVAGAHYVIHNNERSEFADLIARGFGINLQTWTFECPGEPMSGQQAIRFNSATRTLFEPWGTPVSPDRWASPETSSSRLVFWVGSVGNNELDQGNAPEIRALRSALLRRGFIFLHPWPRLVNQSLHRRLIQLSGLRPAICGKWQTDHGYIPCRAFKNLSFGALPITNNRAINVALGGSIPCHSDMDALVDDYLAMSTTEILDRTKQAQNNLAWFTYESNLLRFRDLVFS